MTLLNRILAFHVDSIRLLKLQTMVSFFWMRQIETKVSINHFVYLDGVYDDDLLWVEVKQQGIQVLLEVDAENNLDYIRAEDF
jgi:hypothetical protein